MLRRDFLALLGSAPLAALVPFQVNQQLCGDWYLNPKVVTHTCGSHGLAVYDGAKWSVLAFERLDFPDRRTFNAGAGQRVDVLYGVGYFRKS